jgi:3-oxoacyl-[acyl-carrier protein] reductase
MKVDLSDKIAVVTGASRGLGQAIAKDLAMQGAFVIGTATTEAGAESITQALSESARPGLGRVLNVADIASIEAFIEALKAADTFPDILVNNAGITRDNLFMRMKTQEWDEVIATNLTAVFHLTKALIRPMMKAKWGRIINVSSVVAQTGNPGQANYCAAKAGLVGFSKSIAQEYASRDITVNVVSPGFIDTDMTKALTPQQQEWILKGIPMNRMGQASDIANMVSFLASVEAGYITGQNFEVNGGMFMK